MYCVLLFRKGVLRISFQGAKAHRPIPRPFPFPFLPLPSPSLPFPSPSSHPPPLPLEVGPFNPARGSGERCKLPQRVRAEPGRQAIFGAFWAEKSCWCMRAILCAYSRKKYPKIWQVNRLNVVSRDDRRLAQLINWIGRTFYINSAILM